MAHTIILLTGAQGSGKTTLINLMRKAKEVEVGAELKQSELTKDLGFYETIVFTSQRESETLKRMLELFSQSQKIRFINLKLQ